jgi:hypothetical protein
MNPMIPLYLVYPVYPVHQDLFQDKFLRYRMTESIIQGFLARVFNGRPEQFTIEVIFVALIIHDAMGLIEQQIGGDSFYFKIPRPLTRVSIDKLWNTLLSWINWWTIGREIWAYWPDHSEITTLLIEKSALKAENISRAKRRGKFWGDSE